MEEKKGLAPEPLIIHKENKTNKLLIAITVLLSITCAYLVWQGSEQKDQIVSGEETIQELSVEQLQLKDELEDMQREYQALQTEDQELTAEMELQKAKIEGLLQKVKNGSWEIHKLKKEASTLREIMKGYIVTIDSLNTLNQTLIVENKHVRDVLNTEKNKNQELAKTNEGLSGKVAVAQRLSVFNISAYGVRIKGDNTGKPTDKAKRADKIRTCFTISENKLTEIGAKDLYIRIVTPDGRVLAKKTDDSNRFEFNGVRGLFSIRKAVNYENKEMELCMDWTKDKEFTVGEYVIEIYNDQADIGRTKLVLK